MNGRYGGRVPRRRFLTGLAAGVAGAGALGLAGRASGVVRSPFGAAEGATRAERLDIPWRARWTTEAVGHSVEGRPIVLHKNVATLERSRVLVISAVHGDERGAGAIGEDVVTVPMPWQVSGYAIPIANPDGWARGTRNNANDVDLNRNFPFWWTERTGGPAPASEPETQTIMAVVERLRPHLVVWIHQPYGYVSPVAPQSEPFATAWSLASGLPFEQPIKQHGGGETWAAHRAGLASILVEATSYEALPEVVAGNRRGFEAVLGML